MSSARKLKQGKLHGLLDSLSTPGNWLSLLVSFPGADAMTVGADYLTLCYFRQQDAPGFPEQG